MDNYEKNLIDLSNQIFELKKENTDLKFMIQELNKIPVPPGVIKQIADMKDRIDYLESIVQNPNIINIKKEKSSRAGGLKKIRR